MERTDEKCGVARKSDGLPVLNRQSADDRKSAMDVREQFHWLLLSRLPGCGDAVLRRLLAQHRDPFAILEAPASQWRAAGADEALLSQLRGWRIRGDAHPAHQRALRDQERLRDCGADLLVLGGADYPARLAEIYDPPPFLYAGGDRGCLHGAMLAIVGSRRAGAMGLRSAREFAAGLVEAGYAVCSGMALGIDGEAHRGALRSGGKTVAVMATGIEGRYPRRHRGLADEIRRQGVLVTELPPGTPPRREHFPRRNRLISGLGLGVLVVEAAMRSGSLVTARMALEQNREVFALPHSIYDPGGGGCHYLIRQGARLVETPADILEELALFSEPRLEPKSGPAPVPGIGAPEHLRPLYAMIGYAPVSVDELARMESADPARVLSGLVELQLLDLIESRDGLYMRK